MYLQYVKNSLIKTAQFHIFSLLFTANSQGNERLTTTEARTSTVSSTGVNSTNTVTNSATVTKEAFKTEKVTTPKEEEENSYDSMHLMLEPHLRPVPPDPKSRLSKEIFEEHKDLAKEYLKVIASKIISCFK